MGLPGSSRFFAGTLALRRKTQRAKEIVDKFSSGDDTDILFKNFLARLEKGDGTQEFSGFLLEMVMSMQPERDGFPAMARIL